MPPRRVFVESYGCTTNEGDGRTMAGILAQEGHKLVSSADDADVVVVNTCTVVETTDQRLLHRMKTLRAAGKELVVAGCMAGAQPEKMREAFPAAPLVGPRQLDQIAVAVGGGQVRPVDGPKTGLPRAAASDAIIPLAQGCLFTCSYCLTKKARGDQDSHDLDALVTDIRMALRGGATEIRLTAQDVSGYGLDAGTDLPELLHRVTALGGDFRVRVGMMHPATARHVVHDLVEAMDDPRVYKFLHLPVQSGSESVLRAMGRGHTLDAFWEVVETFRARYPSPRSVVSTDMIVGFPGEAEADHAASLALLRRLDAEHVNVTRFSPRPTTAAKTLPGRVPSQVAKARSREMTHAVLDQMAAAWRRRVGLRLRVLVTGPGAKPGTMVARGPAHEPVMLPAGAATQVGAFLDVDVVAAEATYLLGVVAASGSGNVDANRPSRDPSLRSSMTSTCRPPGNGAP